MCGGKTAVDAYASVVVGKKKGLGIAMNANPEQSVASLVGRVEIAAKQRRREAAGRKFWSENRSL
jgi:hypothetical protein